MPPQTQPQPNRDARRSFPQAQPPAKAETPAPKLIPRNPLHLGPAQVRRDELKRRGEQEIYRAVPGTWWAKRCGDKPERTLAEWRKARQTDASVEKLVRDGLMVRLA